MSGDSFGETEGQRLLRKSRDQPAFPLGIAGFVMVVAYGAYKYKYRGTMSTSIYLIQLRVAAQGTVIGCLCGGLIYTMVNKHLLRHDDQKNI